jgi:hypothetical protein
MHGNEQVKVFQILGWVLVALGMFLPTVFIVVAPRLLVVMVPIACAILVLGLVLVSGRWPSREDST